MPISQMTGLGVVALLLAAVVLCTAQPRELPRSVLGKARIILLYTRCIYELWLTALDWCTKEEGEGEGEGGGEVAMQILCILSRVHVQARRSSGLPAQRWHMYPQSLLVCVHLVCSM